MWMSTIPCAILLIVLINFRTVSSLHCFVCNTKNHTDCPGKIKNGKPFYLVDCANLTSESARQEGKYEFDFVDSDTDGPKSTESPNYHDTPNAAQLTAEEEKVPVCIKVMFHIPDWTHKEAIDTETKKRMTEPRYDFTCGRTQVSKSVADKCVSKNSRDIQQTQCTCSSDKCNGAGTSFYYFCPKVVTLMVVAVLFKSTFMV